MTIPQEVKYVISSLKRNGFEAYMVGGCVRDFLMEVDPNDWDITTNARPKDIQSVFPKTYIDNKFGTVTVLTKSRNPKLKEIEITTYRIEGKYSDKRHPDKVYWAKNIEEDLSRRDFTINAIAATLSSQKKGNNRNELNIIDLFGGRDDIKKKIIKAVGNPNNRFSEDALRMIRAIRFSITLGDSWKIENETARAIKNNSHWLKLVSKERIRDEFMKIIMSERAAYGVDLLRRLGLLKYIIPEIEEGYGVTQNKHHIYDVYEHLLRSLDYAAKKGFNKYVRLAALLHDVGKPRTKRGEGLNSTFYNHEVVGAEMTTKILNRLKFPKNDVKKITKLVRYHLFYYHPDEVGESSVRRLVRQVGPENINELLQVRMADRIGSGVPKAEPYKLRYLRYVIDKISQDPITVKMLSLDGRDIMKILNIKPGPKVGQILNILLLDVLNDPSQNNKGYLERRIIELGKLSDVELTKLSQKAKEEIEALETKRDQMTKKKYWVM